MKIHETELQHIHITDNITGSILDIGGGGEGVIGRAFKESVTAIDKRQDELDEAPAECKKILMDATDLKFDDASFDNITSFFTMMYISKDMHKQVITEAYRVLKSGGYLYLWDAVIPKNTEDFEVFIIQLSIQLSNETIKTGYGVGYGEQDSRYYERLLCDSGFHIELMDSSDYTYKIIARKG